MTSQLFPASGLFAFRICGFCVFASPEILHSEPSALPAHHCHYIYHFLCHRPTPDYHQLRGEPLSSVCFEAVSSDLCLIDFVFLIGKGIDPCSPIHPLHTPSGLADSCCIPKVVPATELQNGLFGRDLFRVF